MKIAKSYPTATSDQESKYVDVIENGQPPKGVIKKSRSHKRYQPTGRVIDDELLYFEDGKQIPLLPTPSFGENIIIE